MDGNPINNTDVQGLSVGGKHKVKKGETLGQIAKKYGVKESDIKKANKNGIDWKSEKRSGKKKDWVYENEELIIPPKEKKNNELIITIEPISLGNDNTSTDNEVKFEVVIKEEDGTIVTEDEAPGWREEVKVFINQTKANGYDPVNSTFFAADLISLGSQIDKTTKIIDKLLGASKLSSPVNEIISATLKPGDDIVAILTKAGAINSTKEALQKISKYGGRTLLVAGIVIDGGLLVMDLTDPNLSKKDKINSGAEFFLKSSVNILAFTNPVTGGIVVAYYIYDVAVPEETQKKVRTFLINQQKVNPRQGGHIWSYY